MHARVTVDGIPLHALDLSGVLEAIDYCVQSGRPHQIVTINLDFLAIARRNHRFRDVLRQADIALADGQPIIWVSQLYGQPLPERIAGVDLVQAVCRLAAERGYRPFLLGAAPGVADRAAAALERRYPGLTIAGVYSPPFDAPAEQENQHMLELVRAARPDFLFVALGAPRQDIWIHEHLDQLGVPVCFGVGGSFDLIAGDLPRAPRWVQRLGFEWLFRMALQPNRLWRRYLLQDIPVLISLIARPRPKRLPPVMLAPRCPDERLSPSRSETTPVGTGCPRD